MFFSLVAVHAALAKPNVLFIVVDDLGTAISPYGGAAHAPNMQRLAAMGTQFRNAYVSIAVCAPSRTVFLTGLRPDVTQVWTIGPYFRRAARGEGMKIKTLPQLFRENGYNATGVGKIFHPGTPSGGFLSSEGGGDMCPTQSNISDCVSGASDPAGSWTEPYVFCDQYTNDTVQSPAMQQWPCSLHGTTRRSENATYTWPSCGGGCVQTDACIACLTRCGTWGKVGSWDSCVCGETCYPEGLVANRAIRTLREHKESTTALSTKAKPVDPFFLAMGLKRPHLSYRAPKKYFDLYDTEKIPLPKHAGPSPSAPGLSFHHNCLSDTHTSKQNVSVNADGSLQTANEKSIAASVGQFIPVVENGPNCVQSVLNRTRITVDGSHASKVEIQMDPTSVRLMKRAYYASVSYMDSQLGRVLDALTEFDLAKNTIITFIGDHGYANGQRGEGGVHVLTYMLTALRTNVHLL